MLNQEAARPLMPQVVEHFRIELNIFSLAVLIHNFTEFVVYFLRCSILSYAGPCPTTRTFTLRPTP